MSVRRKILQKALKRFSKSKAVKGKAMSTAQRRALTKAVKASALKRSQKKAALSAIKKGRVIGTSWSRRKAVKTTVKPLMMNQKFSRARANRLIKKYGQTSQFKNRVIKGQTITAKQQAKAVRNVIHAGRKQHNEAVKAYARSQGGIDWKRSILYSAGLTAALNPSATARLVETTAENASYNADRLARKATKGIKKAKRNVIRKYKKAKAQ